MPNMSLKKNPMPSQEPDVRNKNFAEVALGYTAEQAIDEAQRCLNCKHKPCMTGCPVMIDGTGMCGGCRLSVGGETKFACVDGPDFDGHKVDWNIAVKRNQMYAEFEKHKYEETCNLLNKEVR